MFFVVDMERELEMHPRFFHKNLADAQIAQISKEVRPPVRLDQHGTLTCSS